MTTVEHPHVTVGRGAYETFAQGDLENVLSAMTDDAVWHACGSGPLSGPHHGKAAIADFFVAGFERTGGTLKVDVDEIFADGRHTVAVVRETATRASDGLALLGRCTWHVDDDGRLVEAWSIPDDLDAFFSQPAPQTCTEGRAWAYGPTRRRKAVSRPARPEGVT
ncbi:MAG: nuclear transport factor 2 family protein [Acidimicrobiales bacterium]